MHIFLSALIGALITAAGSLVGRVLLSLGIGMVVFTGLDASITWARDFTMGQLAGTGGNTVKVIGALKIGTVVSILASAYTARLLLNGLQGGTIKKWVNK